MSALDMLGVGQACPSAPSTPKMFRVAEQDVTYADPMEYCFLAQVTWLAHDTPTVPREVLSGAILPLQSKS